LYVFAFDTSQLRGGHRLRPGCLATVIRQVLAPQSWGWFYGQLAWSWLSDVPSLNLVRQRGRFSKTKLEYLKPPPCRFYAYVNLRLLGEIDVAVAPGGRQHRPFFATFYLFFFTFLYWGHWRLWTWLLNSYSSPPESPMDGLPTFRLTCVPAYLRSGLPTFRLTYVPAYLRSGLPTPQQLLNLPGLSSSPSSLSITSSSGTSIFLFM
jgi:hypothetical protein